MDSRFRGNDGEEEGMAEKEEGMTEKEAGMTGNGVGVMGKKGRVTGLVGMAGLRRGALPSRANGLLRVVTPSLSREQAPGARAVHSPAFAGAGSAF